jgi:hypothetical protein
MATTKPIQYEPGKPIRVFLASPGDVPDERAFVRDHLREVLPNTVKRLGQRDIAFEVVSWDDKHDPVTMPAHLTPQQAVIQYKGAPRDCDIVIVIVASRLGTHLSLETLRKPDGTAYQSGTEWEFLDAWTADPRPQIFVFRRTDLPDIKANDRDRREKNRQLDLVEAFFATFTNPDGSARGGYQPYHGIEDFKRKFGTAMEWIVSALSEPGPTEPCPVAMPRLTPKAPSKPTGLIATESRAVFLRVNATNPIAECAEMTLGTTQGSTPERFDLLPEVRFGRVEFAIEGTLYQFGIAEATLRLETSGCKIAYGPRLGDSDNPNIRVKGGGVWDITGPVEGGIIQRKSVGDEPLCVIELADAEGCTTIEAVSINLRLTCKQRHIQIDAVGDKTMSSSVTEKRITEAFIKRCIGYDVDGGIVDLSRVTAIVVHGEATC